MFIFNPLLADQDAVMYMDLKLSSQVMQCDVHASGVMATENLSPSNFNQASNSGFRQNVRPGLWQPGIVPGFSLN